MGKVLRLDRWLHLGFSLHLPGDVDLQAGVRRSRSSYCPPQMLLNNININKRSNEKITAKNSFVIANCLGQSSIYFCYFASILDFFSILLDSHCKTPKRLNK